MSEDQIHERMLQALKEMQTHIEERVRPVVAEVVQAEINRLRTLSEQDRSQLKECLARIDESILSCQDHLHEYRRQRARLMLLNQRLTDLGAEPAPIPDDVPSETVSDILNARVEGLRLVGKI